ncbi:hypothetical protein FZEAL_10921, partial [Fusarium zealandicum]
MSGGWNPVTGRDSRGVRPNYAPAGGPVPTQVPQYHGYPSYAGVPAYSQPVAPAAYGAPVQGPVGGFQTQQTFAYQPNGTGNILPRQPQPCPNIDSGMPAAQMT